MVAEEGDEAPQAVAEEEEVQEVVRTLFSSRIDILVFSSRRARNTCSSRRTWYLASPSMERNVSLSTAVLMALKLNIASGIPSEASLLLASLVVLKIFMSSQERRSFT